MPIYTALMDAGLRGSHQLREDSIEEAWVSARQWATARLEPGSEPARLLVVEGEVGLREEVFHQLLRGQARLGVVRGGSKTFS